jgi:hypothetical protein
MNVTDLTKQQKQYIVLGGIVAAALVVLIVFGVKVSLSSAGEAQDELTELTLKIEAADRALSNRESTKTEFEETSATLSKLLQNIPPQRNYYSWATEIIYAKARVAGLDIDAIDEQTGIGLVEPEEKDESNTIQMESYALRITAHGGYRHIKVFLEQIEKDHPLARVTGIDVSSGREPEVHDVQLFIQWPFNLSSLTDAWDAIEEKRQTIDHGNPEKKEQLSSVLKPEDEILSFPDQQVQLKATILHPVSGNGNLQISNSHI